MNEQERLEFAQKELEAICEDLEATIRQQSLIKDYLKKLITVLKNPQLAETIY